MSIRMDMLKNDKNQGFTLIGLLIAAFIIVTVTIAGGRLFGSAQKTSTIAREQFIATNIAREGLELVHAMRDTNWFTSDERSRWLDHGLCSDGVNQFSDNARTFTIDVSDVRNLDTVRGGSSGSLYVESGLHEWTHNITSTQTPFSRVMTIDCSTKDNDPAYVTITATVTWESGTTHTVAVKEELYNWLPAQRKINP